ncbi:MAG: PTS glucitol/sorbitol transporter subunit IIA [Atopobiaceae bacterium]|jgi:PTS system glucitol/sorbitol-specific IIA component|nr:PTS glucitol/sorbitol transporter subunit IIA [Atopobiaceae bacterium]MCH4119453.1 PTS glucitol/sorbitol transporter subunit IIA [Atopobiaceae bacterium]MCI1318985.1 PTS glucitol/sorbitol transporter subunit IIA [Atopobiaceae bacterium]MCI1389040.1 PTS glucitol/sorbitol transporter subunit IIA [Atopobiaceae bacterium]MCI1431726.1 PTS glucitol/sorbitol transporter subunit IIA [Atopobiaceae bacterium]
MYKTKVTEIGELVPQFEEQKILVMFGPTAPDELKEICVIHEVEQDDSDAPLHEGGTITFGDQSFKIANVGSMANANLKELGHLSIYFREKPDPEVLPGAICATPLGFPHVSVGDHIVIE